MPRLGAFKTTTNQTKAFEAARQTKVPVLITYQIPESRIENPVVNLTVEDKLVYLALDPNDEDLETQLSRFQLRKFGGSLVDRHGNVLKKGLLTSNDMVEAYENLSDLISESRARFAQSLEKGRRLVEDREYKKALRVLKIFAFAEGFPEAEAGKALFEEAAGVAQEAYQALLAEAPQLTQGGAELEECRDAWVKKLRGFSRAWKGSPAARAAKLNAKETKALPLGG